MILSIGQIVDATDAEGPGTRFALWFQGCPLRCPGCCNPEMLPFSGGTPTPLDEVVERMRVARDTQGVTGITLMGGEPTSHAEGAVAVSKAAKELGLSVMVFSGFLIEDLLAEGDPHKSELIALTDIFVDGPYDRDHPDTERRWIGSTNQRIHFLTGRYHYDDRWKKRNTLEIRLVGGELTVNGFPSKSAVGLWKRPKRKPLDVVPPT